VLHATVGGAGALGNSLHNAAVGGADNVVIETLDIDEFICVNVQNNSVTGVDTIDLTHSGGTLGVTQASEAVMEALNNFANVVVSGTVTFNQPVCNLPSF